jgi:hypothetical protein
VLPLALDALAGLADVSAAAGDGGWALTLARCLFAHPAVSQATRGRAERLRCQLEATLTPAAVSAAVAQAAQPFEAIAAGALNRAAQT